MATEPSSAAAAAPPAWIPRAITIAVLAVAGLLAALLTVTAVIARHVQDIRAAPARFAGELILIGAGFAVPYVLIAVMRRASMRRLPLDVAFLTLKLLAAWVLFEISGYNAVLFPPREASA